MNRPLPSLRLRPDRRRGMTFTEIMVVTAMVGVILAGVYSVVYTGTLVAVRGLAINATGTSSRLVIDRINLLLQSSYEPPTLINANGATETGSNAAGIRFYRYVAAPYVVTIPASGLAGTDTTLEITADSKALEAPPAPLPNDALVINTTVLMTGQTNQLRAVVKKVSVKKKSGTQTTYNITLTKELTGKSTVLPNDGTVVTATLIRPTALVVRSNGDKRSLYVYESFPDTTPLPFDSAESTQMTDQIASPEGEATPDKPFSLAIYEGRPFLDVALRVHDSRHDRYLNSQRAGTADDFSSFNRVQSRTPFKCDPNQL
ncbi:MAG TPA: prepilin-type N-terminal cleavage/methylation domain-containing protein [Chthoniobacteraceae bacterium]|nr:prepilin-type N-terminal cleavage/methylation domain-containing protein [Chthoniobacteraceae bacterium]